MHVMNLVGIPVQDALQNLAFCGPAEGKSRDTASASHAELKACAALSAAATET